MFNTNELIPICFKYQLRSLYIDSIFVNQQSVGESCDIRSLFLPYTSFLLNQQSIGESCGITITTFSLLYFNGTIFEIGVPYHFYGP